MAAATLTQPQSIGAYPKDHPTGPRDAWKAPIDHLPLIFKVTVGSASFTTGVVNALHEKWIEYCTSAGLHGSAIGL